VKGSSIVIARQLYPPDVADQSPQNHVEANILITGCCIDLTQSMRSCIAAVTLPRYHPLSSGNRRVPWRCGRRKDQMNTSAGVGGALGSAAMVTVALSAILMAALDRPSTSWRPTGGPAVP
jgi:hypothetical protein